MLVKELKEGSRANWGDFNDEGSSVFEEPNGKEIYRQATKMGSLKSTQIGFSRIVLRSVSAAISKMNCDPAKGIEVGLMPFLKKQANLIGAIPVGDNSDSLLLGRFLGDLKGLDESYNIDSGLYLITSQMDELMHAGKFGIIDFLLGEINAAEFSTDLLLGFLVETLPVKNILNNRLGFYQKVEKLIVDRNEMEPLLLDGLK